MKINQLLRKDTKWAQGALARDKQGNPVNCLDLKYFSNGKTYDLAKHAVSFSLHGAICKCYDYDDHEQVADKIHNAMRHVLGKDMPIAHFNDDEKTTFEDIKRVIAEAGV